MASIKRDDNKQKWEETEFPLVCETCLGDNPYVRMTKELHGKKCRVCDIPFTVFAWQAGTRGRLKRVEICRTCARAKNVCQVCIYDLQYGLPVAVRDQVLAEEGCKDSVVAMPQSRANRSWHTAQQERAIEQGTAIQQCIPANDAAAKRLQSMARMEPRYERNLPKLCSFFAKGECNRGTQCPFRHEMPRDKNDPLSKSNTKDRFFGSNDAVARGILRQQEEEAKRRAGGASGTSERATATLYVRFTDEGVGKKAITQSDVRDKFYSYGEISSVRMHIDKGAFVEFTSPQATQHAIMSANGTAICGRKVKVNWAMVAKRGAGLNKTNGNAVKRLAAPPGGLKKSAPEGFKAAIPAGGGPIKRPGAAIARGVSSAPQPYYASADPGRLGSNSKP